MHSDIHVKYTRPMDEGASRPGGVDCGGDEDDACGMMVEPNETDMEDACCCC